MRSEEEIVKNIYFSLSRSAAADLLFINNDLLHHTCLIIADDDRIDAIGSRTQVDILTGCSHDIKVTHLKDLYAEVIEDPDVIFLLFGSSEHQGKITFVGVGIKNDVCYSRWRFNPDLHDVDVVGGGRTAAEQGNNIPVPACLLCYPGLRGCTYNGNAVEVPLVPGGSVTG